MKIVGYFSNTKTANDTLQKLKSEGFDKTRIDMNEHYIDDLNVQTNLPGTEAGPSLLGLIIESDAHVIDASKAPLTAADPMVSGMGNFDEIADVNCRVIVEDDGKNADRIKQLIKEGGGDLDNPNVEKPKTRDMRDVIMYNALDEIRKNL